MLVKGDQLGCSLGTVFSVQLKNPDCEPVCHALRKYSAKKAEFIDE